jgi:hypothetical protein
VWAMTETGPVKRVPAAPHATVATMVPVPG